MNPFVVSEETGIGLKNERSLHASIKKWYALPGDRFEVKVDNFIIDIVRDDVLIEIQTKNLSSIKGKLRSLIQNHNVKLVYPIPKEKWIVRVAKSGDEILSRRKSPKKGKLTDLFDELVGIPDLINRENFAMEVLMIQEEEVRCDDGKGSWWRKGMSIRDRRLIDVVERIEFTHRGDFSRFLPDPLCQPFSNKTLAIETGVSIFQSQKVTYCLKKMGLIKEAGRKGNELFFEIAM
ncbi:MAG: hypothetical protein ACE5OR_00885 [bacterium]